MRNLRWRILGFLFFAEIFRKLVRALVWWAPLAKVFGNMWVSKRVQSGRFLRLIS